MQDRPTTSSPPPPRPAGGRSRAWLRRTAVALGILLVFAHYSRFRQRYVGACDWYGYYEQARQMLRGNLDLPLAIDVARYPAAAPLAYESIRGRAAPQYPPGFPLLLAAGMLVGAAFYVPPLCAALSVWLVFLALERLVERPLAVVFAALWAVLPIVVWGASNLMSDLPAALAVLGCYVLLDRDRPAWAGATFAFAVAIRPTNLLFGPVALALAGNWRRFARFAIPAAAGGLALAAYNAYLFGAPWRFGYTYFASTMSAGVFLHHFAYYGQQMFVMLTPLVLGPALWAVARRRPRSALFLIWALAIWIFYSFWAPGADEWWWLRFLLPGLPPVLVLAAQGWQDLFGHLEGRPLAWRRAARAAGLLLAVWLGKHCVDFTKAHGYYGENTLGKVFHDVSLAAREALPPDALVGAFEASGALRLYGGFDTFRFLHPSCIPLIGDTLPTGRPVYLLLEPLHRDNPLVQEILRRFETSEQKPLAGWPGVTVVRLLRERT